LHLCRKVQLNPRLLLTGAWARRPAAGYVWGDGGGRRRPPQQKRRALGCFPSRWGRERMNHRAGPSLGAVASLTVLLSTAARAQAVGTRADPIPACYELFIGSWSARPEVDSLPPVILLDTADAGSPFPRNTRRRLRPDIRQPHPNLAFRASWSQGEHGEIYLSWSTGFYGISMRLVALGDVLMGQAESFTDFHPIPEPPTPRASVTAKRVACPSALRPPDDLHSGKAA
jgi:hypothetical protein